MDPARREQLSANSVNKALTPYSFGTNAPSGTLVAPAPASDIGAKAKKHTLVDIICNKHRGNHAALTHEKQLTKALLKP